MSEIDWEKKYKNSAIIRDNLIKKTKILKQELTETKQSLHQKNIDLDALHYVWCTGNCSTGAHRYDGLGKKSITPEIIDSAIKNIRRLVGNRLDIVSKIENDKIKESYYKICEKYREDLSQQMECIFTLQSLINIENPAQNERIFKTIEGCSPEAQLLVKRYNSARIFNTYTTQNYILSHEYIEGMITIEMLEDGQWRILAKKSYLVLNKNGEWISMEQINDSNVKFDTCDSAWLKWEQEMGAKADKRTRISNIALYEVSKIKDVPVSSHVINEKKYSVYIKRFSGVGQISYSVFDKTFQMVLGKDNSWRYNPDEDAYSEEFENETQYDKIADAWVAAEKYLNKKLEE